MGAWGPGVFANHTARDVRAEWREAMRAGADPAATSARLVRRWTGEGAFDVTPIDFWSALAAAQMETGGLQPAVRERALVVIAAWAARDGAQDRRRALDRFAAELRAAG